MAAYGFSWVLPSAVGPLLAGLILDNLDPRILWFAAGFLGLASAAMYYALQQKVGGSRWALVDMRLQVFQQLEEGRLTVEEAARVEDESLIDLKFSFRGRGKIESRMGPSMGWKAAQGMNCLMNLQ